MTSVISGEVLPATAQPPAPGDQPFDPRVEHLVAEWLLGYGSVNTRAAYASDLRHWLGLLTGAGVHPVTEAKRLHVHAWLRAQEAQGAKPATRARRLAAVSAWYTWLIVEEHTERANPAQIDSKRKPKVPDKSTAPGLDRDDVDALLDAADDARGPQAARTAALVYLLVFTGIRVSEAIGADVEDYEIHKGHQGLKITTKGENTHVVVVPARPHCGSRRTSPGVTTCTPTCSRYPPDSPGQRPAGGHC